MSAVPLIATEVMSADYLPLLTLAAMAAFLPVAEISDTGRQLADTLGATQRLSRVHNEPVLIQDGPGIKQTPDAPILNVEIDNLYFTYPGHTAPALNALSVTMPAGQTTALVGPSGAGKSTLAHLLVRFWDPDNGNIRIADNDLREHTLAQVHERVSLVAQDTYLFNESLRANMLIAKPQANEEELHQAIKNAELLDFVASLPDGLETAVGERGLALSGGQRKRISIARAFLRDAPVLVLDEATSHLDSTSERAVHRALETLMSHRTSLIITHRLSTVRNAVKIIVLDQGRVIEYGRHQELLNRGGLYAHLINRQLSAGNRRVPAATSKHSGQ